jgi:UDP-N-acetylglucosamine transferase subunit ALG13
MIFLTVGSSLPFDRLVSAVDTLAIQCGLQDVVGQIGDSKYRPQNMQCVKSLDRAAFESKMADARFVISHAGMGTISMALSLGKPVIVMPRLRAFGEVVNDHQVSTARRFADAGHVLVAYDVDQLEDCFERVHSFVPTPRLAQPEQVAHRIASLLRTLVQQ